MYESYVAPGNFNMQMYADKERKRGPCMKAMLPPEILIRRCMQIRSVEGGHL